MRTNLFSSKAPVFGAAEYLKAKLEAEASPHDLKAMVDHEPDSVVLIDVRDPDSYAAEHIRGAQNLPAADIVSALARLPKDKTIVAYCWDATCALAPKAALELRQKGFAAKVLAGGIAEWRHRGYPVVRADA